VRWQLFPPAISMTDVATVQPEPIRVRRLVAQPAVRDLLNKELRLNHLLIEDAVVPQVSLRGLKLQRAGSKPTDDTVRLEHLRFRNLTWVTPSGLALAFEGQVRFDPGWRPREAEVARLEVATPARLVMLRQEQEQRWSVQLELGSGTAHGEFAMADLPGGGWQLTGELAPRGVEVHSAMASFKRNSVVRGPANGRTELSAQGGSVSELVRSLRTRTRFTMEPATLLRLDVDKTIRTFGQDRAGQTQMASLSGEMETQNTPNGLVVRYRGLEARGETFSARGAATLANRRINAELTVDLAGGLVGVPLKVSGPMASPEVSVPKAAAAGAAAGAAVGTAVLPGVGTAIGAGVGAAIGKLFGGGTDSSKAPPKPKP
jgi:hypothetical protein